MFAAWLFPLNQDGSVQGFGSFMICGDMTPILLGASGQIQHLLSILLLALFRLRCVPGPPLELMRDYAPVVRQDSPLKREHAHAV